MANQINYNTVKFVASYGKASQIPPSTCPEVSFVGRSNVGKSSIMNKIFNRRNLVKVSSTPGKTANVNFFEADGVHFVDLPGYGYAKVSKSERERWGKLMEAYFAAPDLIDLGVMLVDARHKPTANDVTMADFFLQSGKPFIVVANKLDKLKKSEVGPNLACIRETLGLPEEVTVIPFSAEKGDGREVLLSFVLKAVGE